MCSDYCMKRVNVKSRRWLLNWAKIFELIFEAAFVLQAPFRCEWSIRVIGLDFSTNTLVESLCMYKLESRVSISCIRIDIPFQKKKHKESPKIQRHFDYPLYNTQISKNLIDPIPPPPLPFDHPRKIIAFQLARSQKEAQKESIGEERRLYYILVI